MDGDIATEVLESSIVHDDRRSCFAPSASVHSGMAEFKPSELGRMTVAAVVDDGKQVDVARITGLSLPRVRRILEETHGKTLIRNALADDWPAEVNAFAVDEIGGTTVASALLAELHPHIAAIVELPVREVRSVLQSTHGKTLVRNAFAEHWPEGTSSDSVDELGEMTAAAALTRDAVADIADIVAASKAEVRRRLASVHGKTLVRNAFADLWPSDEDSSDPEDDEQDDVGPSAVGRWLNETRVKAGLSVPELAQKAGVSTATIYFIESGQSQNPRRETLAKLERALGGAQVDPAARREAQADAAIEGLGAFTDFNPHETGDLPTGPGVYVFYDISQRPIYVGTSEQMRARILDHRDKFWFKQPIVETGSYVEIGDPALRKQVETLLIKFLKSNAVLNKQNVERG